MQINTKEMGKRIQDLRKCQNIKQKELADEFHIANSNVISLYEAGKRQMPMETVLMYSEKFKVTTDWIIKGDDNCIGTVMKNYYCDEVSKMFESISSKKIRDVAVSQLRALLSLNDLTK